jgi:hypothetical protein
MAMQGGFLMPDMASISVVVSSIKTAADIAKLLRETDVSLEKAETKLKLAELVGALADAKLDLAEVQNLLLDKDKKIMTLEQTLHTRKNVLWESPWYWSVDGGKKNGPFYQQCYDKELKLIRLQDYRNGYGGVEL